MMKRKETIIYLDLQQKAPSLSYHTALHTDYWNIDLLIAMIVY